jgi:hypothetical protein
MNTDVEKVSPEELTDEQKPVQTAPQIVHSLFVDVMEYFDLLNDEYRNRMHRDGNR